MKFEGGTVLVVAVRFKLLSLVPSCGMCNADVVGIPVAVVWLVSGGVVNRGGR